MKNTLANTQKNKPGKGSKPEFKWQTGEYERHADFRFTLPQQFLLLCKLMEVTPNQLLSDFIDNLSCSSWNRNGRENARSKLVEYFVDHGYGQEYYNQDDIRAIFRELEAIGLVWPKGGKMKLIELSSKWQRKFYRYWFKKWFAKPRRIP
ncbi:MAG TPA: hypothetical protein VKR32_03315 [Puia sp.]|nr:hypothetical protein [Puia sp.]